MTAIKELFIYIFNIIKYFRIQYKKEGTVNENNTQIRKKSLIKRKQVSRKKREVPRTFMSLLIDLRGPGFINFQNILMQKIVG